MAKSKRGKCTKWGRTTKGKKRGRRVCKRFAKKRK